MQRRTAAKLAAGLPLAFSSLAASAASQTPPGLSPAAAPAKFKLAFAPHDGMFRHHAGENILDQINWAADQGFTAWEDNGFPNREQSEQTKIGELLARRGMTMGVFVANKINWTAPTLTLGAGEHRDAFLADIRNAVEAAKRCNARWMTVVPGFVNLRLEPMYQFANVMESLKQASGILEPHGLVMVLEPLNYRDHPGLFLNKAAQAFAICKGVGSPACKILFDIYHQQIHEGNLIPNIDAAWDEIAYFQIGDNPGRKEPGTGEINYAKVLSHIHAKGFTGVYGMEHGNSMDGKEGEMKVLEAYRTVDVKA
ncbi:TIM barrel protein [Neolewinella lacunae]|uniref:TIM barrel protein n=1 Tax=Neolewinella lacunae TaxID=1517758 RepID=A0A923PJE5_9BACT|nr:TIM barrel protein [Neolewinella lacunae]MBC6995177.1 TIM barrel protein [Neolewinella lacunae]MDN3634127.1 TIM barrel protein [Neolewinella lacunae]